MLMLDTNPLSPNAMPRSELPSHSITSRTPHWLRQTLAALVVLLYLPALLTASAQPRVEIGDEEIVVTGLPANGAAVLFAISYESGGWYTRVARRDEKLNADAAGLLRYVPGAAQGRSTWAVIDFQTGAASVASSAKEGGRGLGAPAELLTTIKNDPARFRSPGEMLEVLVVQPGVGAWGWSGGDGGSTDTELSPGVIGFRFENLRPIGGSPPSPRTLPAGATVVVIDSITLDFYTFQLGR
jgi:hypothetical protein